MARHAARFASDFYRPLGPDALRISSIGLGTYLGACSPEDDAQYASTAVEALADGINVLDTAINYRCQRSELALGAALADAVHAGTVARDEVILCSKGGYLPLDQTPPPSREAYREYVAQAFYEPGIMTPADVVGGAHCLAPSYLAHQFDRSRTNLGVDALDIYYVHNPEQQLDAVDVDELDVRLRGAFAMLEERCASDVLGMYGCATWDGFRVAPEARNHLSLARVAAIARDVGGESHHCRVIQLPINLACTEAIRTPTQVLDDGRRVPLLQAAAELGFAVIASATLMQSQLAANLPPAVRDALPGFASDAQRAIAFVRALPLVASALVGMKSIEHLGDNLGAGQPAQV